MFLSCFIEKVREIDMYDIDVSYLKQELKYRMELNQEMMTNIQPSCLR